MLSLRFSATDEGIFIARLAVRQLEDGRISVWTATHGMWTPLEDQGAVFSDDVGDQVARALDYFVV